jgi:hypothetical protein
MTATIISFRSHRFTAVDVETLDNAASAMVALGMWGRLQYINASPGPGFEMALIFAPDALAPNLIIKRHRNGTYLLVDSVSMAILSTGRALDDLLAPLQPLIRPAATDAAESGPRKWHWNA